MKVLVHLCAVLVGAAVGIGSIAVYHSCVVGLPVGLFLALASTFSVVWALREARRQLVPSYGLGWLVIFGIALSGRPEGDYAVVSDGRGYALMAASFGVVAVAVYDVASTRASRRVRNAP